MKVLIIATVFVAIAIGLSVSDDSGSICNCDKSLNPICGSDGKSYNNPCLLDCENYKSNTNVQITHAGYCSE